MPTKTPAVNLPVSASRRHPLSAPRRDARAGERGASLVEIMIVLVILLVGVFLAIRIFPIGFGTLRANENRTTATRLAERLLSLAKGDAAENLPQGVLAAYQDTTTGGPTSGQLVVDTDLDPDDLGAYVPGSPNPFFDNVNKFHFIKGEQVKVPLPTATATVGTGSAYTVKFGPIYMDQTVGLKANAPTDATSEKLYNSYLAVNGAPMDAIQTEAGVTAASPPLGYLGPGGGPVSGNLRGPQSFLIDYGDDNSTAYIMFTPRAPTTPARTTPFRTFTVSFSYIPKNSTTPVQLTEMIVVPDAVAPTWQTIPLSNVDAQDLIPGSVAASRVFERVKSGDAWDTSDPYQFKLANDNISSSGVSTYANIGAVLFNPAGANYTETTAYGERAFTAYIDYAVLDWHVLHDDIQVPSAGTSANGIVPVHLAIAPIKQAGDSTTDAAGNPVIYNNLFNDPNPANSYDIIAYDLSNNAGPYFVGNTRSPQAGDVVLTDADPRGGSYRTGTIYVNTKNIAPGTTLRIMYQAEGDYAVALQKAYSQYTCPLVGGVPLTRPQDYNQFGIQSPGSPHVDASLWFPRTDLNKSITATIEYQTAAGEWKRLPPTQMTLETLSDAENATRNGATKSVRFAVVYLNNTTFNRSYIPTAAQTEFQNATSWRVAGSNGVATVQGTSVKARVIWHDADLTSRSWRVHDLDSNLTASP